MRLLAFAASTSGHSINRQLVACATRLLEDELLPGISVETIDLNDFEMPIYSIDRQTEDGIPMAAHEFFAAIGRSDAVLVSFAEHNGFYTAAYKNVFDWASRIDMRVFQDKPTVMLSTSIGQGGGGNVLQTAVRSGQFFGNEVLASLSIPRFHENFDLASGSLRDVDLDDQLRTALGTLTALTQESER